MTAGYNLSGDGYDNMVTDGYNLFSALDIGNYLLIQSPSQVAGFYIITSLSTDRHSIGIQPTTLLFQFHCKHLLMGYIKFSILLIIAVDCKTDSLL